MTKSILRYCCFMLTLFLTACFEGKQTIRIHDVNDIDIELDARINKKAIEGLNEMQGMQKAFSLSEHKEESSQKNLSYLQQQQQELLKIKGVSQFQSTSEDSKDGDSTRILAKWHVDSLEALEQSIKAVHKTDISIRQEDGNILVLFHEDVEQAKALFQNMLKGASYTLIFDNGVVSSNQPISWLGATQLHIPLDTVGQYHLEATINPTAYPTKLVWLIAVILLGSGMIAFVIFRQKNYKAATVTAIITTTLSCTVLFFGLGIFHQKSPVIQADITDKTITLPNAVPIPAAPIMGNGHDLSNLDNHVQTSQGVLFLSSAGKDEFERPDLYLDDTMLLAADMTFIKLERQFHLSFGEAIVISQDEGGTGTFPHYMVVLLQPNKAPLLLTHDDFYSEQHQINYAQKGDIVTMDIGLQNGIKKIITLEDGQLLMGAMQVAKKGLSTESCQWLHESVLDMCAQSQSMGSECDEQSIYEPSMIQTRGLNEIRANPNFNEKAMTAACYQACQQKAAIPYSQFEVQVCGK